MITFHGSCGKSWTQSGNATSHCSGCHLTFVSLDAFERHQKMQGEKSVCRVPDDYVMTRDKNTGEPLWNRPLTPGAKARFARLNSSLTPAVETGYDSQEG